MQTPRFLALVGPTASGKSEIALQLARKHDAEILSCDSLLVYKHLTIGTAKPSPEEMAAVPHHGIDLVEPDAAYTAGDYVRFARPIVEEHARTGKPLLIVGGTGFYLKALLMGTWDAPPTQPEFREKLDRELAEASPAEFHAKLAKLDPEYAAKIPANDVYRVIRAREIIEITGEPLSRTLARRDLQNPLPFSVPILGIRRDKRDLERRIVERTDTMFAKGLVAETRDLFARYPEVPRSLNCVGYFEVLEHLQGRMTLPECRERIVISTRQLAKKQLTFFKSFPARIQWFALPQEEDALVREGDAVLEGKSG